MVFRRVGKFTVAVRLVIMKAVVPDKQFVPDSEVDGGVTLRNFTDRRRIGLLQFPAKALREVYLQAGQEGQRGVVRLRSPAKPNSLVRNISQVEIVGECKLALNFLLDGLDSCFHIAQAVNLLTKLQRILLLSNLARRLIVYKDASSERHEHIALLWHLMLLLIDLLAVIIIGLECGVSC